MNSHIRTTQAKVASALVATALTVGGCSASTEADPSQEVEPSTSALEPNITVVRQDALQSTPADAARFAGDVIVTSLFSPNEFSATGAGHVEFAAGARTAWHTHPAGQRLIITGGSGWVQEAGRERVAVSAGDVVWFAPSVKHWHGASSEEPMTHIAVQDTIDGSNVEWMEQVSEQQYAGNE